MTIFLQDVEAWYAEPLWSADEEETTMRAAGLALSLAILRAMPSGQDQLAALQQVRQACILARDCHRLAVVIPRKVVTCAGSNSSSNDLSALPADS